MEVQNFFKALIFGASLLGLRAYALEGMSTIEQLERQIQELQEKVADITAPTDLGRNALQLVSARPDVNGTKWFVTADILYWHPRVSGTAFAYTNSRPTVAIPIKGRTKKIDFGWEWGFRFGIGRNFCHDKWDLYLNYTNFDSNDSTSASAGYNSTVVPLKGSIITGGGVGIAKSHFSLDYDAIDLELGRHFFVSGKLSLRPFLGLKTAWIDLSQVTRYTEGSIGVRTEQIRDDSDFWGLGPRLGFHSEWDIRNGFRFVGDLSAALMYGYFDISLQEKLTSSHSQVKLSANEHRFLPNAQLFLGFGYGTYCEKEEFYISIDVGYEAQYFWRANQMLRVYEYNAYRYENISEDMSMHGITFKLRLDF